MPSRRRLPHRMAPLLSAALMSGLMSLLVSGVATWKALGLKPGFGGDWLVAWASAWPVACATLLVVAPLVRRVVASMVEPALPDAAAREHAGGRRGT